MNKMVMMVMMMMLMMIYTNHLTVHFITAPVGVGPPISVIPYSGYMVGVEWEAPQSSSGLLTKTIITAYNLNNTELPPVTEQVEDINVQAGKVDENNTKKADIKIVCRNL